MIDFPHSANDVANAIARMLATESRSVGSEYMFTISLADSTYELRLERSKIEAIIRTIEKSHLSEETTLYTDDSFEIFVRPETPFWEDCIRVGEMEGLTYELSKPSDPYLIYILMSPGPAMVRRRPRP